MDASALAGWSIASSGSLFPKMHLCLLRRTGCLPVLKSEWQSTDLFLSEISSWSLIEFNESHIVPRCTLRAGLSMSLLQSREKECPVNQIPELSAAEPSLFRWGVLYFLPIYSRIQQAALSPGSYAQQQQDACWVHPWLPQLDSASLLFPPARRGSYFTTFDSKSFVLIELLIQMICKHLGGCNCHYQSSIKARGRRENYTTWRRVKPHKDISAPLSESKI